MSYWACAQLEPQRTELALHFLSLNGFQTYCPRLLERVRVRGRKTVRTPALFPGYCFLLITHGWWTARWSPGVVRLIQDGLQPAHVADAIIDEIRSRENRAGLVELRPPRGLTPGQRVRILQGPLHDQIGMLAALRARERVLVLLTLLGGERPVELARNAIEAV